MGKADLHIHSYYSQDALSGLKSILKKAKKEKLEIVAITDHNVIKGAKEAKKMGPEFGIEVIIGEEIETKEGDIVALFIQELIKPKRPVLETVKEIHQQGGLAIVAHPDNWLVGGINNQVLSKVFEHLDGIELFNGSWKGNIGRQKNEKLNKLIFNLAPIGGSDAHLSRQVGCAFTIFPGQTSADLYISIKEKLTSVGGSDWSYKDRLFWLINSPRFFYRCPQIPLKAAYRTFKKILN